MDLIGAMGEIEEYGGKTLVPESLYPVKISVGEIGTSDVRDDGGGGTPFVEITGTITGGPFNGTEVTNKLYLTPGKVDKGGKHIGHIAYMAKAITGKPANQNALTEAGFACAQQQGEDDTEFAARVKLEFAQFFAEALPATRLATMANFVNINGWDGKTVIASVALESYPRRNADKTPMVNEMTGEPVLGYKNTWSGFYPLNHEKRGMKYVTTVCFPKQEQQMSEQQ